MKLFGKTIPVWILIAVVCAGTVAAGYCVWSYTFGTTVTKPITVKVLGELPASIDPGMGTCAKYLIHNSGAAPLTITVTMTTSGGTELEGFTIVYSNEDGEYGPLYGMTEVINSEDEQHTTYTFTIGTYDYTHAECQANMLISAGMDGEAYYTAHGTSSYAKIFAGFKVSEDAAPGPLDMNVEVFRG